MALDPDMQALRTPPHSIEAEQSVLGALIIDNNAIDKVADLLRADDFYNEGHRLIYEHINRLAADNNPADAVTFREPARGREARLRWRFGLYRRDRQRGADGGERAPLR